jgi:hypothetical protein
MTTLFCLCSSSIFSNSSLSEDPSPSGPYSPYPVLIREFVCNTKSLGVHQ